MKGPLVCLYYLSVSIDVANWPFVSIFFCWATCVNNLILVLPSSILLNKIVHSYVVNYTPSALDFVLLNKLKGIINLSDYSAIYRWFNHIKSYPSPHQRNFKFTYYSLELTNIDFDQPLFYHQLVNNGKIIIFPAKINYLLKLWSLDTSNDLEKLKRNFSSNLPKSSRDISKQVGCCYLLQSFLLFWYLYS